MRRVSCLILCMLISINALGYEGLVKFGKSPEDLKVKTYGRGGTGSATTQDNKLVVTSQGTPNCWGNNDAFTYVYKEQSFPYDQCSTLTTILRVDQISAQDNLLTDGYGIMLRSGDQDDAANVNLHIRNSGLMMLFYRAEDKGATAHVTNNAYYPFPADIKLVRNGNAFSGFIKVEDEWVQIGRTVNAYLGDTMLVGMGTWSASDQETQVEYSQWETVYTENYIPPEENYVDQEPVDPNTLFRDNFNDGSLNNLPESATNPLWKGITYAYLPKNPDGTRYWRFEGSDSFTIGDKKWTDYQVSVDFSFDPAMASASNIFDIAVRVKSMPIYSEKMYISRLANKEIQFHDNSPNWRHYRKSFNYLDGEKHNMKVKAFDGTISLTLDNQLLYEYLPVSPRTFGAVKLTFTNCYINIYKIEVLKCEDPINGDYDNLLGYGFDQNLGEHHTKWVK